MGARIVLLGTTGYTGELTARALVAAGARPLLAGRRREPVAALAAELGELEWALADVADPPSVRALLRAGDVLVTTVGPFARLGAAPLGAALDAGAHYLDSTGEAQFVRSVFARHADAARAGCTLVTACGFDFVPGNLAAALALRAAGGEAVAVDVAYFAPGVRASGGTRASLVGILAGAAHAFRDGRLVSTRIARDAGTVDGRAVVSIGASEQLALPRLQPALRDVRVWIGGLGPGAPALRALSAAAAAARRLPGARPAIGGLAARLARGAGGGPDAAARARVGSEVVAIASEAGGAPLATVRLSGPDPYDLTARLLAWAAGAAAGGGLRAAGALGPVEAFGADELEAGLAGAGMARVD